MENKISHEGELDLNGFKIPCYVLENGERVLSTAGMQRALGLEIEANQRSSGRLQEVLTSKAVSRYISDENDSAKYEPILCYQGKKKISAYKANILPEICETMLKVRDYAEENNETLGTRQRTVIEHADILIRALARVGIIALVDEATGYQYDREKDALQVILKAYISEELLKWQKMFPDTFYYEIFRLNKWDYTVNGIKKRPGVIGKWTNELIYKQLPKDVLEELQKRTPKSEAGNYTARFFQSLTPDIGHPSLTAQIYKVIGLMNISNNWNEFKSHFNRMVDRNNGQMEIDFDAVEKSIDREEEIKPENLSDFDKNIQSALNFNPNEEKDKKGVDESKDDDEDEVAELV